MNSFSANLESHSVNIGSYSAKKNFSAKRLSPSDPQQKDWFDVHNQRSIQARVPG